MNSSPCYLIDDDTHDVIVETPFWLPATSEVKHHVFAVNAFPHPPLLPLVVRRESLRQGKDMGRFCNDDFFTLRVIRGGHGLHVCNDHPYGLTRGDAYLIPPRTVYSFHNFQDVEMDVCYFQNRLFNRAELAALHELSGFWKLSIPSRSSAAAKAASNRKIRFRDQRLHLSPEQFRRVEAGIAGIHSEIYKPVAIGALMARHLFFCLLGTLAQWHSARDESTRLRDQKSKTADKPRDLAAANAHYTQPLAEVIDFCEHHFQQPLSVLQLAARVHLSPDRFSKLFTQQMGMPPATFLRQLRLEHAQTLLRDTTFSLEEITHQCGFKSGDVLARAFRAAFGMTPSQYRKSFRAKKT